MEDASPEMLSLFAGAMERPAPEERAAFLESMCGTDLELRHRIDVLLRAHEEAGGFLQDSPTTSSLAATADPIATDGPGTIIGPYKLLEQIGEGGFGIVFMAEQTQPVRRKVALKVLKPGMDTRQVVARFEVERQALAIMDHSNIAKILDAGQTSSGRPYFVMDLVKGLPITDYCDQAQFVTRQRLELFVHVCRAVQHAHQKGIIHRDIKPSNVLVTLHDGAPLVKVIDFGIAKALGQQLTDKTVFTGFAQMIGTPLYMSPEQAVLSNADVDTRSDVYALGVLLYELLTGTTPFDKERLKDAGYDELRRIIREEEPPRPSLRISTLGQAVATVSAHRQSDPKRLSQLFRGELDWIAMKALEKDRNRRYETVSALAADVQRYLNDEPVQAYPPSAGYRLRKLARRHKRALLTAGLVLAALVVGTAVSAWQAVRATRAQALAQERLETAESNLQLARQAVDERYVQVADDLAGQPHVQPFQRDVLEKALRFYEEFARRQGGGPEVRRETASALLRVGQIRCDLGHARQAMDACEQARATLEALAAELPADPRRRQWLASTYMLRGGVLALAGRHRQAEEAIRQALALYGELAAEFPDDPDYRSQLAATQRSLGGVLSDRPREAEQAFRESVRLSETLVAERPDRALVRTQLGESYHALGNFLVNANRFREAQSTIRQAIDLFDRSGPLPERTGWRSLQARAEFELGRALEAGGQRQAAETAYRQAVAGAERLVSQFPDMPSWGWNLAGYSVHLAAFLERAGRPDEAVPFRRRACDLFEKLDFEFLDDRHSFDYLVNVGLSLRDAGDPGAAERFCRKALAVARKLAADAPDEPATRARLAEAHRALGIVLQRRRHLREAAEQYRQELALRERLAAEFPDEPVYRHYQAGCLNSVGIALRTLPGEETAAMDYHDQALALCERLVADFPDRPLYRTQLVRSHFARGIVLRLACRHAEADRALRQALAANRSFDGTPYESANRLQYASIHNELAWMLATCPDLAFRNPERAVASAREAVKWGPRDRGFWNTLGVAYFRAGKQAAARAALVKSMEQCHGGDAFDWFFLAMLAWQQGQRDEASQWYRKAIAWTEKNRPQDEELRRFRAEAAAVLGASEN